jgi:hypothetical protein
LVLFEDDFPIAKRKLSGEHAVNARRRGDMSIVIPAGLHVYVREPGDVWELVSEVRGRGQPRKVPTGGATIEDFQQLVADVKAIIGGCDERAELEAGGFDNLKHLAFGWLGIPVTQDRTTKNETTVLRRLCYGHRDVPPAKATVIARYLLARRHGMTDPAVRRLLRDRRGHPRPSDILIYL